MMPYSQRAQNPLIEEYALKHLGIYSLIIRGIGLFGSRYMDHIALFGDFCYYLLKNPKRIETNLPYITLKPEECSFKFLGVS